MSDKSFGDHINRNVVKNSLLSSAVIGLSLEDLTHKAVLLPASPSQGQVTGLDQQQGTQAHALAHSDHDRQSFPSGDAFSNISLSSTSSNVPPSKLVSENYDKISSSCGNTTAAQSKAPAKSEDDFDVNEYIARLQGTWYVSAPLHSHLKEDPNPNLGAEEALEEINLNESRAEPVQQSLTADIAQNFSQLPTVLPHMASAVFSSFSNMLSMKSREQTPEKSYQEVQLDRTDGGVPLMGVEENTPKDFGLPPKEPPVTGASNYRITSKKKYAQIPGLSYGGTQNVYQNPNTPFSTNQQTPFIPLQSTADDTKDNDKQNTPLFTPADNTAFNTVDMFGADVDKAQSAVHMNVPSAVQDASFKDQNTQPNISQECQFAPIDYKDITTPRIPIIPPPPMFSNLRSNQAPGKSVLPPSVARRISANQPLIKPPMPAPVFYDNIFVPSIPESNVQTESVAQFSETVQPHLSIPSSNSQSSVPVYTPPEKPTLPESSFFSPKTESSTVGFYTPSGKSEGSFPPTGSVTQAFGVGSIGPSSIPVTSIGASPIGTNIYSSVPVSNASSSVSQPTTTQFVSMFTPSQTPNIPPTNIQPSVASIEAPIGTNIYSSETVPAPVSSLSQPSNTTPFIPMFTPSQATIVQPPLTSVGAPATNLSSENIPAATPYSMPQPSNTTPFVPMFAPTQSTPFFPQTPQDPITQMPPGITPKPAKPIIEPPKAAVMNFRMTKKRPQYYSGPLGGLGTNNVKAILAQVIPPLPPNTSAFPASFFTPEQKDTQQSPIEQGSVPFDISKPVEPVSTFEVKAQAFDVNPQQYPQEYNTAFDFSRTTEAYEPPKQESKGFGIIGSLKSKLSSIDMNKIQSSVTTFFDPAYNVAKGEPALETAPYSQQQYGQYSQEQNFEVTVPSVDQNQYSQFGHQQYSYDQSNQYYQAQQVDNYQYDGQNTPSFYNQASYTAQQVIPVLNTDTYEYSAATNTQENIPQNVANISDNVANKDTQEISFYNPATVQEQIKVENVNQPQPSFEKPKADIATSYVSPNVGTHGAIGDVAKTSAPTIGIKQGYKHFVDLTPQAASFFDNPLTSGDETKPSDNMPKSEAFQSRMQFNAPLPPAMSFFDSPSTSAHESKKKTIELVDEMEKLALAEEIAIAHTPLQEIDLQIGVSSEFPVESSTAKTVDRNITTIALDKNVQNFHINKEDVKTDHKTISLMESLSKDVTPVVAVSSVPLFGLSAVIDKGQEPIPKVENVCLYEASKEIKPILESTSFSLFKNTADENKVHKESPTALGLSMADVKNVLLMEPPQDNLGTILQRTTSLSLLKDLPEAEVKNIPNLSEDRDSSWNLDATMVTSKDNVNLLFDRKASGFFDHLLPTENLVEETVPKDTDATEQASNFNICETCREVTSPENKETDNVTNKLIENMNSSIQLSNPVETVLAESIPTASDRAFEDKQFDDINRITEDTMETLQGQSAAELLDNAASNNNYGWNTEQLAYATIAAIDKEFAADAVDPNYNTPVNPEYTFKIDPNAIGFFGDNSMFFDNVPKNASDEIKAEFKTHEDELPQQMTLPSAPPAEYDTKSDETGVLDVLSIEQDAKKDFPLEEEFIIEPDTDDDKIEFRERKKSSEDSAPDTFADRIEKFKSKAGSEFSSSDDIYQKPAGLVKAMPSYFDTGNYAVETHFRKSLTSPTNINTFQQLPTNVNIMQEQVTNVKETVERQDDIGSYVSEDVFRLPPGFEDEIRRQLLGQTSSDNKETFIPETSTQTRPTVTTTYNIAAAKEFYTTAGLKDNEPLQTRTEPAEQYAKDRLFSETKPETYEPPTLDKAFGSTNTLIKDHTQALSAQVKPNTEPVAQKSLPDPMNFFTQNEPKETPEAPESFNRLASYFSMPPAQPDHSKSFFELSQSQNHYRHVLTMDSGQGYDSKTRQNLQNLMLDLTSTQNINPDNVVRTVNYFSVEYENPKTSIPKLENVNLNSKVLNHVENNLDSIKFKEVDSTINKSDVSENKESDEVNTISTCKYCCNIKLKDVKDYKVRTASDSENRKEKDGNMTMSEKDSSNQTKSVSVDIGHSGMDEEAQDGVTLVQESRSSSEYTPVRHHWFYRVDVDDKSLWRGFSTTDSNALEHKYTSPDLTEDTLVPTDGGRFDVNIIGRLRIAVYWKEKPTNVRRCSWFYKGTTDARYVPYTEAVADKLEEEYRHGVTTGEWHRRLVLPNSELVVMHGPAVMVHFLHAGADSFSAPPTTSRPRVVRRGHEESEIEDPEPSSIDHLLLLCHGVGSACDMRFRPVEEVVEDFRTTSLQLVQSHYRNSYDNGIVSRVEVLPISWHAQLHVGEGGVDKRLNKVTLESIPRLRAFTNHTVLDALFYTSPAYHQLIIDTVCFELNRIYNLFKARNPNFKGGVSLGGHSLGSVILYDLLCHQTPEKPVHPKSSAEKTYLPGATQPLEKYPQLQFLPAALYALGSPIAIFECIRGVEALGMDFALPTCKNFFNIFHPYDPIAYRIEPLINPLLQDAKPFLIPHHKGRKRMHLELKDTMVRVGADLKQKLIESLRTTWNKWKATPPPDGQLEKVVEEEIEKEQLFEETKEEQVNPELGGAETLGNLNAGRRVDYVLQEAPLEMINEYLFAMSSHVGYWESEDTMLLMLREIYSSLGVQPDCTVPQQSMTVTRTTRPDEATVVNEKEYPSTSRGST